MGSVEAKLSSVDSDLWHVERWFSQGSLVTDGHDGTDLSFKVALNTLPSISLQTYEPDIHLRH